MKGNCETTVSFPSKEIRSTIEFFIIKLALIMKGIRSLLSSLNNFKAKHGKAIEGFIDRHQVIKFFVLAGLATNLYFIQDNQKRIWFLESLAKEKGLIN